MVMPNHERIGKALILVRDGVKPTCELAWHGFYGDDWLKSINQLDNAPDRDPSTEDLAFLLKGVWNTWRDVWRHQFGHAERNFVSELREARNRWAHQESFSVDDTYRVLDTCERLLVSFHAGAQVDEVRTLKQDLLRQRYAEEARTTQRKAATAPTKGEPTAGLTPWREVVDPHPDVREGRLEQAEFAADLYQVVSGRADEEYLDPVAFFRRTFITQGLRDLLVNAGRRLSGDGGDPVVELQTNFGGGKTHSLIALYHLASGRPLTELPGAGEALGEAGVDIPKDVQRAVFVGQMVSPASPRVKPDGTEARTIWGDIAWQLGGAEGYALVEAEDREAKNPGDKLVILFEKYGPAIVLIDEWVAYARGLPARGGTPLPAGDFDTQFTFAQALTEAAKAVPNVLVLVSIPSSDIEVGGDRGHEALTRLKNVVSRTASQWQPATADETFEIVRRRLFEPVTPDNARVRDGVVKAYVDYYRSNSGDFPNGVGEAEYRRRMEAAYPIHPELFDRLYSDWSTLDRFQRTRGVLRLMASVVSELWKRDDRSLLIMPGALPVDAAPVLSELTKYLEDGWEPVIRSDVDGPNSLPLRLDQSVPNLGRLSAARRAARTVYMGSAPREEGRRGVDVKRVMLGCVQPGEAPGVFGDALRRLSSDATYLYVDGNQYWYSLQPNVIRLAHDRAASNFTDNDADDEIRKLIQAERDNGPFGAVHVFPGGPGDIPDDPDHVRLVVLDPTTPHTSNDMEGPAVVSARAILEQRQGGPRLNRNLLVFLAADVNRVPEIRSAVRQWLAWRSIVADKEELNLNEQQRRQAESKAKEAQDTVTQRIGETFQLVLTPRQEPASPEVEWQQTRASSSGSLAQRVARRLISEEKLVEAYSGVRVRMDLDKIPLWEDNNIIKLSTLWSHYAQRPYLTRLASFDVLARAVEDGVASMAWDQETFGYADHYDPDTDQLLGFSAGHQIDSARREAFLVQPEKAMIHLHAESEETDDDAPEGEPGVPVTPGSRRGSAKTRYYGRVELDSVRAIRDVQSILENIVSHLEKVEGGGVSLMLEVQGSSDAFDDRTQRVVKENASQLGFIASDFEE